jgi:hypothetical protein
MTPSLAECIDAYAGGRLWNTRGHRLAPETQNREGTGQRR